MWVVMEDGEISNLEVVIRAEEVRCIINTIRQ